MNDPMEKYYKFLISICIIVGLLWLSSQNYLLFHTIVELYAIIICFTIVIFYRLSNANEQLQKQALELRKVNNRLQQEINERKDMESKLEFLSFHDSLTGLYNRAYFDKCILCTKILCVPISIVTLDIDSLKKVNDNLGHQAGDELIKSASTILKESFRMQDIVIRMGGDEFAVILPNTNDLTAAQLIEVLQANIDKHNNVLGVVPVFMSAGYATDVKGEEHLEELLQQADKRMYENKRSRREEVGRAMQQFISLNGFRYLDARKATNFNF